MGSEIVPCTAPSLRQFPSSGKSNSNRTGITRDERACVGSELRCKGGATKRVVYFTHVFPTTSRCMLSLRGFLLFQSKLYRRYRIMSFPDRGKEKLRDFGGNAERHSPSRYWVQPIPGLAIVTDSSSFNRSAQSRRLEIHHHPPHPHPRPLILAPRPASISDGASAFHHRPLDHPWNRDSWEYRTSQPAPSRTVQASIPDPSPRRHAVPTTWPVPSSAFAMPGPFANPWSPMDHPLVSHGTWPNDTSYASTIPPRGGSYSENIIVGRPSSESPGLKRDNSGSRRSLDSYSVGTDPGRPSPNTTSLRKAQANRRSSNRDEFDGPHQYLDKPFPETPPFKESDLPQLPTNLLASEQDDLLNKVHDCLSQCAFNFVAKYQFPIPIEPDKRQVATPGDREWTEWVHLLKRLATKRRVPARVLYNGQIKQFVTVLENSLEMRHAAKHQSRPLKDDRNVLRRYPSSQNPQGCPSHGPPGQAICRDGESHQ